MGKGLPFDPVPGVPRDDAHKEEKLVFFLLEIRHSNPYQRFMFHETVLQASDRTFCEDELFSVLSVG